MSQNQIRALRGMNDILPDEISLWQKVERTARDLFGLYQYHELRTPIAEEMGLFTRTLGDTTNIVEKEMYVFQDKNDKWLALRPEGTASIVRAYIEHNLGGDDPIARYYYMGPMYRYERPQKGRFRQFYQIGAEAFGISNPRFDAEVIQMAHQFFRTLGLSDVRLEINSLGCATCRPLFLRAFFNFLKTNEEKLCFDCRRRMERNPLRALDCNNETCQALTSQGPSIQDHLCETCKTDFKIVLSSLEHSGTPYQLNAKIVRGLDYYLKTTFEFSSELLGAQKAVAGGGRYDGLVQQLGGKDTPGFGFAIGMERLIDLLKEKKATPSPSRRSGVFIAALGEKELAQALQIAARLRQLNISVDLDYETRSLKSQMRRADKAGFQHVAILGSQELEKGIVLLRDLLTQTQQEVALDEISLKLENR